MSRNPFKIAFPMVTLPPERGGLPAIVLFSFSKNADASVGFASCIDSLGRIHQQVPISMNEIRAASLRPVHFLEVEGGGESPVAGGVIVPPGH